MVKSALALALVVTAAWAASDDTLYITEYYDDCSTLPTKTVIGSSEAGAAGGGAGSLTTYTTVYDQICSTGFEPKTFTVTEPCTESGKARPSTYIPQGFVKTTVTCHVCAETPVVAVITTPVPPPKAPGGPLAPAAPTPTGGYPSGSSPGSGGSPPPAGVSPPAGPTPVNGGSPPAGAPPSGASPPSGGAPPANGGSAPGGSAPPAGGNSPGAGGAGSGPAPTPARYGDASTPAAPGSGGSGETPVVPFTGVASNRSSIGLSILVGLFGVVAAAVFTL